MYAWRELKQIAGGEPRSPRSPRSRVSACSHASIEPAPAPASSTFAARRRATRRTCSAPRRRARGSRWRLGVHLALHDRDATARVQLGAPAAHAAGSTRWLATPPRRRRRRPTRRRPTAPSVRDCVAAAAPRCASAPSVERRRARSALAVGTQSAAVAGPAPRRALSAVGVHGRGDAGAAAAGRPSVLSIGRRLLCVIDAAQADEEEAVVASATPRRRRRRRLPRRRAQARAPRRAGRGLAATCCRTPHRDTSPARA